MRRLAADHSDLHNQPLPPNYLFPPSASDGDDLTQLDILLSGPSHTPFETGLWKLHLTLPTNYPQQPPTAHFRTPIFHPNVDPQTGGVCVETLKRDWDSKLTLRDILVTINCLLIQPNPDSALNADAGALIQEDYAAFAKRARLMTSIHAGVPKTLQAAVREAQSRGQDSDVDVEMEKFESTAFAGPSETNKRAPVRRRLTTQMQRGAVAAKRTDGSPSGMPTRRRQQADTSMPFVLAPGHDDPFGMSVPQTRAAEPARLSWADDSFTDADQENDETKSPMKARTPKLPTPRRPQGASVPLGELNMEVDTSGSSDGSEPEYPPSPRKSPSKSAVKRRPCVDGNSIFNRPESSREAAMRAPNLTPPNASNKPLAEDSPFSISVQPCPSLRKGCRNPQKPGKGTPKTGGLFGSMTPGNYGGIFKPKSPSSAEKRQEEKQRRADLDVKLWRLSGGDVKRWNRGDFDGEPFKKKAARW